MFGLGAGWAKYFNELGGVPLPVWFQVMAGSNGDFGAMVAVMSASDSAGASAAGGGAGVGRGADHRRSRDDLAAADLAAVGPGHLGDRAVAVLPHRRQRPDPRAGLPAVHAGRAAP